MATNIVLPCGQSGIDICCYNDCEKYWGNPEEINKCYNSYKRAKKKAGKVAAKSIKMDKIDKEVLKIYAKVIYNKNPL